MEKQFTQKLRSAVNSNEKGFTLLEVMLALSIFMIIIFFITPILQIILDPRGNQMKLQEMEWEVFSNQFKKEIRQSSQVQVKSGKLYLIKGNETVNYEKYDTNLRRRVNDSGHEIVLQNVSVYSFSLLNNAVKLTVRDSWGKEYSIIAYSIIDWDVGR
ncbi:competence type IV pilus minor pilin ComGF [Bacillus rubiinfantis]|uniref:competence type IV pilus minor pilin ComGF n=1 Tax=Bacillus rubiinfantis TaxID=1499680 RepID=UPI0006939E2A|nr:competence type IV pilus minor pilin ComGF [Bacillus rubiinfantis]